MDLARPRTRLALWGAAAALAAGALVALALVRAHHGERAAAPPASRGGLVIDPSGARLGRIDPAGPLRCFVDGQLIGELSLAECARRNGVATDALGVGMDTSGVLAAGRPPGAAVTPLTPRKATAAPAAAASAPSAGGGQDACWRYAENHWRRLPSDTTVWLRVP